MPPPLLARILALLVLHAFAVDVIASTAAVDVLHVVVVVVVVAVIIVVVIIIALLLLPFTFHC